MKLNVNIYKANWNPTIDGINNTMRVGVVNRDNRGEVVAALCQIKEHVCSSNIAEIKALWRAMLLCSEIVIKLAKIFEEITNSEKSWTLHGQLIE